MKRIKVIGLAAVAAFAVAVLIPSAAEACPFGKVVRGAGKAVKYVNQHRPRLFRR